MRAGLVVLAILVSLVVGRLTVQERPPRIERVREPVFVTHPPPVCPARPPRRRATLEDVRRDWGITERLVCHTVSP
jgi:hypothetical protein